MKLSTILLFLIALASANDTFSSTIECSNRTEADLDNFQTILKLALVKNKSIQYKVGDVLVTRCPFHEYSSQVVWYKNSRRLRLNTNSANVKKRVRQQGHKLVIKRLLRKDRGTYNCQVATGHGLNLKSPDLILNFQESHVSLNPWAEQVELENQVFSEKALLFKNRDTGQAKLVQLETSHVGLDCSTTGDQQPQLTWHRNGVVIAEPSSRLELDNVTCHDSGEYQCQVQDSNKTVLNRTFYLYVIKKELLNRTAEFNGTVILECELEIAQDLKTSQHIKWFASLIYYDYNAGNESSTLKIGNKNYQLLELKPASFPLVSPHHNLVLNKHYSILPSSDENTLSSLANNAQLPDGSLLITRINYLNIGFYVCMFNNTIVSTHRIHLNLESRNEPKGSEQDQMRQKRSQPDDWLTSLFRTVFSHPPVTMISVLLLLAVCLILVLGCVYAKRSGSDDEEKLGTQNEMAANEQTLRVVDATRSGSSLTSTRSNSTRGVQQQVVVKMRPNNKTSVVKATRRYSSVPMQTTSQMVANGGRMFVRSASSRIDLHGPAPCVPRWPSVLNTNFPMQAAGLHQQRMCISHSQIALFNAVTTATTTTSAGGDSIPRLGRHQPMSVFSPSR